MISWYTSKVITVKRFATFEEAQSSWESLEKQAFHYPFQAFWYQKVFAEAFSSKFDVVILGMYEEEFLLAIGGFEIDGKTARFLGTRDVSDTEGLSQDITDFGDLLWSSEGKGKAEEIWESIKEYLKSQHVDTLQLDYVRDDSPTYLYFHTQKNISIKQQEVSPFITLPYTWDEYLESLSKKDRHELKRKIKRLETQTSYKMCTNLTMPEDFEAFIRLHRLSDFQKEKFMTEKMKQFFWDVIATKKDTWDTHICSMFIDDKEVAAIMVFTNDKQMLLYNSGFDPEFGYFSVGLLIKAFLVKKAIEDKVKIYDFLRGNERYKYDLGAKDMPLFGITIPLR